MVPMFFLIIVLRSMDHAPYFDYRDPSDEKEYRRLNKKIKKKKKTLKYPDRREEKKHEIACLQKQINLLYVKSYRETERRIEDSTERKQPSIYYIIWCLQKHTYRNARFVLTNRNIVVNLCGYLYTILPKDLTYRPIKYDIYDVYYVFLTNQFKKDPTFQSEIMKKIWKIASIMTRSSEILTSGYHSNICLWENFVTGCMNIIICNQLNKTEKWIISAIKIAIECSL
tara:strand:- start:340 stop:1020 length:681 start_codon:yes stop_codon:yes gene_type:complete